MTKYIRTTHDENNVPRDDIPRLGIVEGIWPTCCIHMLESDRAMTATEIHQEHLKYDKQFEGDCPFDFSFPQILEGLAVLIRLGWVGVVEDSQCQP